MSDDDDVGGASTDDPGASMPMLAVPRPTPGTFVLTRVALRRARQVLPLPVLAVIVGAFWEAVDLGIDLVLGALGVQLGLILVLKPLGRALLDAVQEDRRIRRIRKCVTSRQDSTDARFDRKVLQRLKLCPGSGSPTWNRQDWQEGKCQHCLQAVDASEGRVVDHLLHLVYFGQQSVECDPRLIPALLRYQSRDREPPPPPVPRIEI